MNWEAIGAIAELLGSLVVVLTLIFLAVQLRANSVMIKNATLQNSSNAISEWARQLAENPDLYRIYRTGLVDDSALSNEDRGRFDLVLFQAFNSISNIYEQYDNGGLERERWKSELNMFGANYNTPGGRASWERQKFMLTLNFQEEVKSHFDN